MAFGDTDRDQDRDQDRDARRNWMAVLARTPLDMLERARGALADCPAYTLLKPPEVGLALVRGRAGGSGARFNLGEATVTRCVLRLDGGALGIAYVLGRSRRRAELTALFDALLQDPARRAGLVHGLIAPQRAAQAAAQVERAARAAATRVEFFTVARETA